MPEGQNQESQRKRAVEREIGPTTSFWWWCAGVDEEILARYGRADSAYYTSAGVSILLTGILASLTGGYALYTMLKDPVPAVVLGLLWGATIFTFDRFIVSTMHKEVDDKLTWPVRLGKELRPAFPRLVLALALGIGLARPAELKFFESEIADQMRNDNINKAQEEALSQYQGQRSNLAKLIEDKRESLKAVDDDVAKLKNDFSREMDGTGGSRRYGYSVVAKMKEGLLQAKEEERQKIADDLIRLEESSSNVEKKINDYAGVRQGNLSTGFLARTAALGELKAGNESIKWASWFITFLICWIEMLPKVYPIV